MIRGRNTAYFLRPFVRPTARQRKPIELRGDRDSRSNERIIEEARNRIIMPRNRKTSRIEHVLFIKFGSKSREDNTKLKS